MACYMSAEEERVIEWKPSNLLNVHSAAGDAADAAVEFWRRQRSVLFAVQRRRPVTLGVQSYSFRDRSLDARLPACRSWG